MAAVQRSTLVVGVNGQAFERLAEILRTAHFFADYVETGAGALESIALLPFDALVVGYPLPDMAMQPFLDAVRKPDSPCRQAAVVLLASRGTQVEAEALVGRGANRVVSLENPLGQLPHALFRLLEVPPRFAVRAISRLHVQLASGTSLTLCQTENISSSGMLIRTDHGYPIGTKMDFELTLPGEGKPVRGYAVVVRHTVPHREPISGVGVRISSFDTGDKPRFEARLVQLAS
jgi:CheY-like chemotaxis protein